MFKHWELVLSELKRELDACLKNFKETKLEEKPAPRKSSRFSLSLIGLVSLAVMAVIALVIFGGMYYKYNGKHRRMVIALCTVIPITSLVMIVFFAFLRKKYEAP